MWKYEGTIYATYIQIQLQILQRVHIIIIIFITYKVVHENPKPPPSGSARVELKKKKTRPDFVFAPRRPSYMCRRGGRARPRVVWTARRWTLANFGRSHRTNRFLLVFIIYLAYYMHVRAHSVVVSRIYTSCTELVVLILLANGSEERVSGRGNAYACIYVPLNVIYKRVSPPPHVSDVFICVINKTFFFLLSPRTVFYFCFYIIFFLVAAAAVSCRVRIVRVWVYNIISNIYRHICIYMNIHIGICAYTHVLYYINRRDTVLN